MSGQDCCPEAADDLRKDSAEAASLKSDAQSSLQGTCSRQAEPVKGFFLQDALHKAALKEVVQAVSCAHLAPSYFL